MCASADQNCADHIVEQACSVAEVINKALDAATSATEASERARHLSVAVAGLERLVAMSEHYPFIVLAGRSQVQAQIRRLKVTFH